ncbi:MAG: NAD-dependent epimerase/dehydratase family protein [Acidimicrobiia bacterium]
MSGSAAMKIAVTGALGRVGRAMVDAALSEGHEVTAIDRVKGDGVSSDAVTLDLTDYGAVVEALDGCDALVHLAAISGPDQDADHVVHDNNVVSSYHAMRAAIDVGITRICQASSINAIGGRFSRDPHYDYFPVDERHPSYAEDPYSLSKWICEQQADALARRFDSISIASLRLHGIVESRDQARAWQQMPDIVRRQLWGYTTLSAAARAFLLGITAPFAGHEVFYVVAPDTMADQPSDELANHHYPNVSRRSSFAGDAGFFDTRKAAEILGWTHGSP